MTRSRENCVPLLILLDSLQQPDTDKLAFMD